MKNNLVSIIVNCHNGEKYLSACFNSILHQTYVNWEVIFWDNNSKDSSKKIFKKFKNKKFKYFFSKKKINLYKARSLAISKAKGEFIAFLDTDDMWFKKKLEIQIKKFKENRDVDFIFSNISVKNEENKTTISWIKKKIKNPITFSSIINDYKVGIVSVIFRKKILKKFKLNFNPKYKIIGDFDLFAKIIRKVKSCYINKNLALYRLHKGNFTKNNFRILIDEMNYWVKKNISILSFNDYFALKKKIVILKLKYFLNLV